MILKDGSKHFVLIPAFRILFHITVPWYLIPVFARSDLHDGKCKFSALLEVMINIPFIVLNNEQTLLNLHN